jgi:hypothetical protein
MDDSATPARDDPHSLAPVQIEIPDIDEDIALLKRGKGARLMLTLLCGGLAAFGIVRWMDNIDGSQAYAAAADHLEAINAQQGNAFMRCVLPDVQRSQLASPQALHTAFENASERTQKYYGKQLQRCAILSQELEQQLNQLDVPADMYLQVQKVRWSARELNHALAAFRGYLQDPVRPYDYVQVTPMIERLTIAWTDYEAQRAQVNRALREHP